MKKSIVLAALLLAAISAPKAQDTDVGYLPITGDVGATVTECTGTCYNNRITISLYSTPLDEMGYVSGAGDMINLEFYTAQPGTRAYSIAGVYSYVDTQASSKPTAGALVCGNLYEIMPGYEQPAGTVALRYGEFLDESVALASEGSTLTITDLGAGIYKLQTDLYTRQGSHITANWTGALAECIHGLPTATAQTPPAADIAAKHYDLQGHIIDKPTAGRVYITVQAGTATKERESGR